MSTCLRALFARALETWAEARRALETWAEARRVFRGLWKRAVGCVGLQANEANSHLEALLEAFLDHKQMSSIFEEWDGNYESHTMVVKEPSIKSERKSLQKGNPNMHVQC